MIYICIYIYICVCVYTYIESKVAQRELCETTNAKFEQRGHSPWTLRRCFSPRSILCSPSSFRSSSSSLHPFRHTAPGSCIDAISTDLCHTATLRRRYFVRVILHFCTVCVYLNVLSFYRRERRPDQHSSVYASPP